MEVWTGIGQLHFAEEFVKQTIAQTRIDLGVGTCAVPPPAPCDSTCCKASALMKPRNTPLGGGSLTRRTAT